MFRLPPAKYQNLMSEFTDVDTFIIVMDSLLVEIMLHDYLSWVLGGQSLLVVYMLESFLKSLEDKGGRFHLVWFDKLEICFQTNSTAFFMREIVKTHFSSLKDKVKDKVFTFQSPFSSQWLDYVQNLSPSFVFCSNGSPTENIFPGFNCSKFKECLTGLIYYCSRLHLPVVNFDGIQQNAATFFGFRMEPFRISQKNFKLSKNVWDSLNPDLLFKISSLQRNQLQPIGNVTDFWHFVVTLLRNNVTKTDYEMYSDIFLKAMKLQQEVPIELRAQSLLDTDLPQSVDKFCQELYLIAAQILQKLADQVLFPVFDIIDGRFFARILLKKLEITQVNSNTSQNYAEHSEAVTQFYRMKPLTHEIFDFYAKDLVNSINNSLSISDHSKEYEVVEDDLFLEKRHWHSGKLIKDNLSTRAKKKSSRQHSRNLLNWFDFYGESLEDKNKTVFFYPPDQKAATSCSSLNLIPKPNAGSLKFSKLKAMLRTFRGVESMFKHILDQSEKNIDKKRTLSIQLFLQLDKLLHKKDMNKDIFESLSKQCQDATLQMWQDLGRFLKMDIIEYRLAYACESIEIHSNAIADPRVVGFTPDSWQRELLTVVDNNHSALIIAPTSAGKTFISYYCIEKVLREDDDHKVVYVCPTKALVNQVAATINVRFKHINLAGQVLFGVFNRDYRKDVLNARVLVTVPNSLEILLLSPQCQNWRKKLKYAIFDEVHCIGGGVGDIIGSEVWEHIILLVPCPFLALSATIGNIETLHNWLLQIEKSKARYNMEEASQSVIPKERQVKLVTYNERHSELKLFLFNTSHLKSKQQLVELNPLAVCNMDIIKMSGLPSDQQLNAKQIYKLWEVICSINKELGADLKPIAFFGDEKVCLNRQDLRNYECHMKEKFVKLMQICGTKEYRMNDMFGSKDLRLSNRSPSFNETKLVLAKIVDLVLCMMKKKILPCLCFSDNRRLCENFAFELRTRVQFTKPDVNHEVFRKVVDHLKKNGISQSSITLLQCLENGIGYHHSGMTITQRQVVEILFRSGFLQIVFSTATLALGIHMPCKTVVLSIDSQYMTPLQYRQMIGRAGRRGFDNNGNVIFYKIPAKKIERLLTASLPNLRANLPFTVSYILRLLALVASLPDSEKTSCNKQISTLLQHPFIMHTLSSQKDALQKQLEHYFVYSCHFLNRMKFINPNMLPVKLAGIVTHISYHEPGNFIFAYFLKQGVFHRLCQEFSGAALQEKILLIMSHLFTRIIIPNAEKYQDNKHFNSDIILRAMPDEFDSMMLSYNTEVFNFYVSYLKCLAGQLFRFGESAHSNSSVTLPYSNINISSGNILEENNEIIHELNFSKLSETYIGGPVFSISGRNDSQLDLINLKLVYPLRQGIYYDRAFVPAGLHLQKNHRGEPIALNAYALNFWSHGNKDALITENGLMEGDVFNFLLDFLLVLKAINVSLLEFGPPDDEVVRTFGELAYAYNKKFQGVYQQR